MSSKSGEIDNNDNTLSFIIGDVILGMLFIIGLSLQIKIILISKREKDMTWKLDICNSIVMIGYYSFRIFSENILHFYPEMNQHVGKWFCYVSFLFNIFGALYIASYSLIVVVHKYFYILHHNFVLLIGKDRYNTISFCCSLFIPMFIAISYVVRPEEHTYSSLSKCMGVGQSPWGEDNTSMNKLRVLFFCGFDESFFDDSRDISEHLMNVISLIGCFLTTLTMILIISNCLEAFFYLKIFTFMKRYVSIGINNLTLIH